MARISDQLFGAPPSALRGAEDDEAALLAELDAKASAVRRRPAPAATTAAPSEDEAALLQELDAVAHQTRVAQTEGGKVSRFAKGAGSTLAKPEVMAATVERAGAGLGMAVSASDVAEYDTLSPEQQGRIKRELGGEDVSWTERLPFTDTHLPGNTGPAVRRFEGSMPGTPDAARAGAAAARLAEARIGQNAPGVQLADSYGGDAPVFDRVQRAQGAARLMGEDRSPLAVDMFEASAEKAAEVQETVLDPHRREMYQRYGEAGALGSGLIESIPSMAAGIGIGVATRNAAAGARVALPTAARIGAVTGAGSQGAMSAGTAYADAVDKGLNPELAKVYAVGYGAAELIPSAWSLDTILSAGGRNALARMGIGAATEGAQESVTAVLQAAIDKGMVDPDMTFGEAWDRVWQGAMLGSMLGAPMGAISGIGADTENTEGRSSPGADAMTNGQPPLQNPPGLTADELLAVIQQNTGAPANAEPMSPEMDRQQKIEQARARAQTQRELTDTFTNSTDVLRRENVAVTDDGLEVPDAAAPAQDPLGRHADPRSDHYALTVLAKDLSDELGFQARPEDLDLIAQDIAKGTDPKRAVRDRMKAGEAFAIAQRRRERKASALGQDETNPENLRDFRAGAPTDYTSTDGEPLPTTITPRMQQERGAAADGRSTVGPEKRKDGKPGRLSLDPRINMGQPGMSPRNAVDRISTDAVSGLRGTHIPGQQPDFGPSSPMPRQGETFDATEFDQQERQRQNTRQGRGLPESVTLGRNQQELRPGFTDNTGDQAVAAHPGRPQDAAPVEQPAQPERAIDRLRKRRADKRPAPQTPDVIVPETDGELPDLDLGPEPEARRPMSPDEERDMETWAARQGLTNLIDDIPASSGMEAGVDALLNQGYSLDDITDVLETKLARARAAAAAAGTDRAKRTPAEAEVARLQGVAHLLLQRAENADTRPDFELTPDDQEQTPEVPEQEPTAEQGPKLTAKQRLAAKKKANAEIDAAAAATNTAPTDAQKESGNYAKGKVSLHGFTISIENPKGSVRSGTDRSGKPWKTRMKDHYGYIRGTTGNDADHVDVFIGPDPTSDQVFIVDQVDPETGKFDEHKVVMGARDEAEARTIYQRNYAKGWNGAGAVTAMSMADFKQWSRDPARTKAPVNPAVLSSDQATDQETETDGNPGPLQREADTDTAADDNGAGASSVPRGADERRAREPIPRASERDADTVVDVYAGSEEVGQIPIGVEAVETAEDAMHVLSYLRRRAQEHFVMLGLDENNRPVAIFRNTIGTRSESQVDFLGVVGSVLRDRRVTSVWMGHNHPSGTRKHSGGDINVMRALSDTLGAAGVEFKGSVILGSDAGKGSTRDTNQNEREAAPRPAPRNKGVVAVVERVLRRAKPGRFADAWTVTDPDASMRVLRKLADGQPGVVFLNSQHTPLSFVPVPLDVLTGPLKAGGRDGAFAALVREAEKRNAGRALVSFGDQSVPLAVARNASKNIGVALANVDVGVLDVIGRVDNYKGGEHISFATQGLYQSLPGRGFFHAKANTLSSKPARGMATDAVRRLADKFVADLSGALGIKVEVLAKQTDHPELAQLAEDGETVRSGYNPRTKTVTLVAENLANAEAVFAALRHEILGHHGLRSVLSDADYKQVIDAILATKGKSKGLDAVWETVDANYGDAGDIIRAEEVFTHVAEQGLTNLGAAWAKVKAAVLQALRKVGLLPKTQISEAEVQALIQSIAQGMKKGTGRDGGPGGGRRSQVNPTAEADGRTAPAVPTTGSKPSSEEIGSGESTLYSKSSNNPNRRDLTADEKIGRPAPAAPKSFIDQLEDLGTRLLSGQLSQAAQVAETEILDRFLPVKALEAKMRKFGKDITAATSAYVSMRLSTSVGSVVEAMLRFGAPQWQGGVIQHKPGTIGLLDAFGKLGSDTALNDWLAWMAAHRAEELMRSGRESNLDRNDIRELKARVGDRAALFEEVRKDYNAIKSAVLDLQQSVGLIDPDSRAQWESNWYVPFYRADESVLELDITGREDVKGKSSKLKTLRNKNRLSNQDSVIKALKGSELPTRDLLSNIMANLSGGIDAAMKQDAMVKLVRNLSDAEVGVMSRLGYENQVSSAQRNADGVFYVRERGRKVYYHVDTTQFDGQELFHTIAELGWLRTNDGAMGLTLRMGRTFKRVLTRGITATPPFIVRNMIRDSISAWMISPDHFRLGVDTARGIKESLKQGEYARAMAFAGATFQGGFLSDTDPDAVRNEIKRMLAAQGIAQEEAAAFAGSVVLTPAHMKRLAKLVLAGPHLALSKWLTFGERMENANRIAVYMRALENGRGAADAAYEGKDLMDYSLMGRSNVIKFLSDISPFMNARIQGNYKTVRSLANRQTLARGLMVAGATLLLAAMNAGEDWYERLPDWERDTYWHIKVGDELFRIPKPFELGVMFATVPERLGRLALNESGIAPNDETGKTVLASLGWNLWNTSQIFTMPSPVSAAWQLGTNENSFTKLPIETQADRAVSKSQRYGEHTSLPLVYAGDALETVGMSPKQAEHLVGAVFGTVGLYGLAMADGLTRWATDAPAKPEARDHESRMPGLDVLGVLYRGNVNDVPVRTKHEDEFYKMLKETGQVYATFDKLAREGQREKARELLAERPGAIQMAQALAKTGLSLRKLQDAQTAIMKDPKMTTTEKRRRIDKIRAARQAITKQQVEAARPLLDKDE